MSIHRNEKFADQVLKITGKPTFSGPVAVYDPDGDCIEFIARPDDFYAERVDNLLTVYYSRESGEIVGSFIKGVRSWLTTILQKHPGFGVDICEGKVRLGLLFRAKCWGLSNDQAIPVRVYRKLVQYADDDDVVTELPPIHV